jgi:transcriptional antiterminator NusG
MDIHENEDQLGENEPMTPEPQALEETPEGDSIAPEVGEDNQPTVDTEQAPDPAGEEEASQEAAVETPESESTEPENGEDLQAASEAEETSETEDEDENLSEEMESSLEGDAVDEEETQSEVDLDGDDSLPEPEEVDLVEDVQQEEIAPDPYASVTVSEEPVKEPEDGRVWYVVHCYSGNEDKVRHNIMQRIESMSMDDLIFDVVVPTEDEVNIKNGERQTVEKKVFPGYILVNMILTEESWYMVRNTPGVTGFVGMGNDPTPLQPEEVARILKRMESESPRINVTFRPGERVRIVDGPFEDFYGKVAEIDMERATVRVMVNFFGRETPVELDFLQVEPA